MKRNLFILMLLVFSLVQAQQDLFVSGQVLDSVSNKGLESCAVGFYNTKNKLVTGTTTDHKGYFEMALKPGKYLLVLDYITYQKKKLPVYIKQNNQFLGTFVLKADKNILKSVEIKARNKAFKIDKDIYIVSRKMKVAAANTNDVLDKIQGVTYDRYNNQIKVDGETNIKILVDGLEKDPEYIQNLNPERLKKIEIMRDPAGKYALDGYTAVINVILKKNYTGTELNLSNQSVFDADAPNHAYIMPMSNSSIGYTYTYNKLNLYTKYGLYSNSFNFPTTTIYHYQDGHIVDKQAGTANNMFKDALSDRLTFGVDYYLNPRHTLSFESGLKNLFYRKNKTKLNYRVKETFPSAPSFQYDLTDLSDSKDRSNYQSIFYIGKFDAKNELRLDATLSYYQNQGDNQFFTNQILDRQEYLSDQKRAFRLNADYTHQLNDRSSLEFGYGFYHQKNQNVLRSEFNHQEQQQNFELRDTRHKAFTYYAYKLNKNWSVKAGLAGEMSLPKVFGQQTRYFIYQPYLDIKHKLSKKMALKFKYRTESDYPGLSQANPNTVYIDPQTVQKGNPNLAPAVTHQLALRINFFGGALFAEPYYHFSNSYIGQVARLRQDGIIEQTYENIGHYKHYGIKGNVAVPFSKKLFWQTNFNIYHSSIKYQNNANAFNDYSLESNLVYVNRAKGLTSGFIYQRGMNKYITAQGYHKWNNDFLGFLLQKSFMKRKLNLMLLYMLPIDFGVDYVQEEYTKSLQYESLTQHDIHLLKNVLVFRLNYRFSKGKATRKTKKNIDEETPKKDQKGIF